MFAAVSRCRLPTVPNGINPVIDRICRVVILAGLFVTTCTLATLFTFLLQQQTGLYALFALPMGRVYTIVSHLQILALQCNNAH